MTAPLITDAETSEPRLTDKATFVASTAYQRSAPVLGANAARAKSPEVTVRPKPDVPTVRFTFERPTVNRTASLRLTPIEACWTLTMSRVTANFAEPLSRSAMVRSVRSPATLVPACVRLSVTNDVGPVCTLTGSALNEALRSTSTSAVQSSSWPAVVAWFSVSDPFVIVAWISVPSSNARPRLVLSTASHLRVSFGSSGAI